MESVDSSPNYMRARSRFDANKENSPGGSECDENMCVGSSNGGSAVNGPYTRKLSKKAYGNIRSFRRRAKPRVVQSPLPISDEESFVGSSQASPHYLKATTSSQGKKTRTQPTPLHSESTFDGSDKNTSHSSHPNFALSRTSSFRNVRILIKRTSFKPKRSLLRHSKASDVGVERATYSSTLKDSKFPIPVELHHGVEEEPEKRSAMKVCRYHHCSLHGHCHGSDDPAPPLKRFLHKRRQLLKKQKSLMPKTDSVRGKQSSDRKKNLRKRQIVPEVEVEPLNQERFNDSIAVSGVENKNGLDSHEGNYPTEETQLFGDGYKDFKEPYLVELVFGESSFPERSYQDNLSIVRKYSLEEQDFGGRKGYCSTCSSRVEEVATTTRRAKADINSHELSSSHLDGNNKEILQNGPTVTNLLASFKKPKEAVDVYIEDIADTPVLYDETEKGSVVSSASSNIQTSTGSNSEEEAESITESLTAGDSKVNEVVRVGDSERNTPTHDGGILRFSKPRHKSMWNLIHLHMSSNLPVEPTNKLVQGADGESPVDGSSSVLAKGSTDLSRELSDTGTNDSEIQEIELRKLFAVKLVREAIEKILLPEVQDQASDDQSIASESTPRAELVESNQAFAQENAKSDAERVNGDVSSEPKEDTGGVGDASGREIKKAEKEVVRKSEKKAPKHWSNLKKWILLQRFFKELEKVRKLNHRKPQHLPLNPEPETEKVNLRPQTLDGRKSAEEWMLDHALRQAVSQLAPTQKKKVSLLVRAFETVVPPQEDSQVQFKVPRVRNGILAANGNSILASDDHVVSISNSANKDMNVQMVNETEEAYKGKGDCESLLKFQGSTDARNEDLTSNDKYMPTDDLISSNENGGPISKARSLSFDVAAMLVRAEPSSKATKAGNAMADFTETESMPTVQGHQDAISDSTGVAKDCTQSNQMDRKNHIKMWHMIYQHVVSGIAEKVGSELLEGGEEDEADDNYSSATNNSYRGSDLSQTSDALGEENRISSNLRSRLTKSDAVKLVKEAVDEILHPEIQDDDSDTQMVTSESDIPERNLKAESLISKKSELSKSKNWSKLKKLILLKRSIKALREFKAQPHQLLPQTSDPEPEKVDLRQQMMDERKKAEQWMLDYAVQHIVTKLTPARKRRVFMLVEAFEAVVPFPEI